jgi:hypothetical protein
VVVDAVDLSRASFPRGRRHRPGERRVPFEEGASNGSLADARGPGQYQ